VLLAGAQSRASDIHIEAGPTASRSISHRGFWFNRNYRKEQWPRIISRIKLMAGLKINITAAPQDGRICCVAGDRLIFAFRLCLGFGESVVIDCFARPQPRLRLMNWDYVTGPMNS
jgi:type II secretory ATPase GspE/PulE/Tfp pilus assembly ATPase PilB-like protein